MQVSTGQSVENTRLPKLELQGAVRHPVMVLGTKLVLCKGSKFP